MVVRSTAVRLACTLAAATGLTGCSPPVSAQENAVSDSEISSRLAERIRKWHAEAPSNKETLKLVYFHPANTPPLDGHHERLTRIMSDIRDFLRDEMHERYGFDGDLAFEFDEAKNVILRDVQGQHPGPAYQYPDAAKIRAELESALVGDIDFDNDFVLVISGLCRKREDGSYLFHAPYYGDGSSNQRRGLCWAADCEMLDTLHLTREAARETFRYQEHLGSFERNLAEFNALYIGGLAHELGHGLSLPHNGELWSERDTLGTALMGSGNFTYRRDRFTDQKGSFLTLASALRLAVHPLFTQSDRGRDRDASTVTRLTDLRFTRDGRDLVIDGRLAFDPDLPPIAVIAYKDPEGGQGYDAKTDVAEIDPATGTFRVFARNHKQGAHELRLTFVHPNGATTTPLQLPYQGDKNGQPDAVQLNSAWLIGPVELLWLEKNFTAAQALAERQAATPGSPPHAAALAHLLNAEQPPLTDEQLVDLSSTQFEADRVELSTAVWEAAEVGWGQPRRDYYFHGPPGYRDAVLLRPGGIIHTGGFYAHAPSRYVFHLGGKWRGFTVSAGMQGGVPGNGQARFIVLGDDSELFRSDILTGTKTVEVDVDISGVQRLTLMTESGRGDNHGCWSVWGSPVLTR